jgi:hypothetical protein
MSKGISKSIVTFFLFLSLSASLVQRSACSGKKQDEHHQKTVESPSQSTPMQVRWPQNTHKDSVFKINGFQHIKLASGRKHQPNSMKSEPGHQHSHRYHLINVKTDHQDKLDTTKELESMQPPMTIHHKNRTSNSKQHMTPAVKNNNQSHHTVENEKQPTKALDSSRNRELESMIHSADKATSEIVGDTVNDDISEEHEGSGKQVGELREFQVVKNGCYSSHSGKPVKEGELDVHPPSCQICECLHNKLYCIMYC